MGPLEPHVSVGDVRMVNPRLMLLWMALLLGACGPRGCGHEVHREPEPGVHVTLSVSEPWPLKEVPVQVLLTLQTSGQALQAQGEVYAELELGDGRSQRVPLEEAAGRYRGQWKVSWPWRGHFALQATIHGLKSPSGQQLSSERAYVVVRSR